MIESIIKYSEFTCGIILFLFAVIQLTYKNRQFVNYNIAGLYFCLSYVILAFWTFKSGLILHVPWLLYTDMTTAFAIGPFVYFYIKTVLGIKTRSFTGYLLHFIPALVVLCVIIANNLIDDSLVRYYRDNRVNYPLYGISPVISAVDLISDFYMLLYFGLTIKNIYTLLKNNRHQSLHELKTVFYYMFFIVLFTVMLLIANIAENALLNITAVYLLTISGIWFFYFSFRYPEFTQKAIREAKVIRYRNFMLQGVDAGVVLARLDELMEDEKIYLDYDLTLPKLGTLLMITPHQLSKILNVKRKMNFRSLINAYRVKESMQQMACYPGKTVLETALACGFNSKSSFNAVFMKTVGITPSDYKKSLRRELVS